MSKYEAEIVSDNEIDEQSLDDFFKEMGVEATWNKDLDDGLGIPEGYTEIKLGSMADGEIFDGRPSLSKINTSTFEDKETGEKKTRHTISLVLIDDKSEEAYIYPISLKSDDELQKNISNKSKLYSLIMGLAEIKQKGSSQYYNELPSVKIESLRKMVNSYESMEIECVTVYGNFTWNNFKILDAK